MNFTVRAFRSSCKNEGSTPHRGDNYSFFSTFSSFFQFIFCILLLWSFLFYTKFFLIPIRTGCYLNIRATKIKWFYDRFYLCPTIRWMNSYAGLHSLRYNFTRNVINELKDRFLMTGFLIAICISVDEIDYSVWVLSQTINIMIK